MIFLNANPEIVKIFICRRPQQVGGYPGKVGGSNPSALIMIFVPTAYQWQSPFLLCFPSAYVCFLLSCKLCGLFSLSSHKESIISPMTTASQQERHSQVYMRPNTRPISRRLLVGRGSNTQKSLEGRKESDSRETFIHSWADAIKLKKSSQTTVFV